ncbi:DNA primase [Pseudaestuariivita atlantica]|uniref:DNA primase n=1 Tax=Pseudaestuariivita atlantica TaxID=1317121 RepID=A0A0L1JLM0_9RHOB|nr:DNA primase [Pseudaestuariivita atlantica]KNG92646.1 DNA primase [Pseudaestuariivita atlantica]
MSLPPGFLDELRTRLSIGQVVGRKVMWDQRKSNQAKGDLWAPCPFHQEKTASFHVDDRKGYYYCFGCHAKGDAISFVRETENVSFIEAIEILAGEAGMQMPARDPRAQEKADRRSQLAEVMERAVQFYRLSLRQGVGAAARDYLKGRGLDGEAADRFEIGFAPEGWQVLWDHLKGKGVEDDLILGAGLAKPSQKGGKPYDTFRNRIMFPIRDPRGRCIAFGGRAMDPNDGAKYLNSPETELFDKSRTLYNHGPAREAAGKGQPLIVAEGYMDVIALVQAGFGAAVAPLGTAVTEHQLAMLWRVAPEPVVALDGDTAGLRAAYRVIDLALPLLEAGQSLRFALMPEGQDPDDLIRASGAGALQERLDAAMPMVRLLWQRETEGQVFDSPERKAALDRALRDRIKLIRDPSIRSHYGQDIKEMRWQLFRPARPAGARPGLAPGFARNRPIVPVAPTRASALVADAEAPERMRVAVILATCLTCPDILDEFEGALETIEPSDGDHRALRDALLRHAGAVDLREAVAGEVGAEALETLMSNTHVAITPSLRDPQNTDLARATLAEELAKLDAARGHALELAEAVEDLTGTPDETLTWRLAQAAEARDRAMRSQQTDTTEYDTGDNGARINRDERAALDALMEKISFEKRRK